MVLAVLCAGQTASWGQAPGPLSKGHEHLDGPLDCVKCHEGGTGVPDSKCLGCHDHRELAKRIEAERGFHADAEVKGKPCKDCHAEHKEEPPGSGRGKRTTIDWRPFGGKRNFTHQRAGWPLEGAHRFQKCEKCHTRKSKKTKLTIFLGLRAECTTCHKNPHEFGDVALTDCTICHNFDNRRVASLAATKFDHDKTAFPLDGLHLKKKCVACHEKTDTFLLKDVEFKDCAGCHEDSHRSVISAQRTCKSCHSTKRKFKRTKFDHGKETRFGIRGQHTKNDCKDCHTVGSPPQKPSMSCAGCHEDIHRGRFGKEACESCHVEEGWKTKNVFNHGGKTEFALAGAHAKTPCVSCHRDTEPKGFERFTSTKCADCHRHTDAHCGQFGLENCERCHVRSGDRTSRFDHELTGFKLVGAHAEPSCDGCHKPARLGDTEYCANAIRYTGLDSKCSACHDDVHQGELGADCAKCHTSGRDFKTLAFDHNRDAQFPLTGFHQLVECESCHPRSVDRASGRSVDQASGRSVDQASGLGMHKFKTGKQACEHCHLKDDPHIRALGTSCAKCHETTGGAPKFDHDVHTEFLRRGVHARIECARCHFLPPPNTDARTKLGQQYAAVSPPGAPLDLQFRSGGVACVDCHPDPHKVRGDVDCAQCHGWETWQDPPLNGYHERAGFALVGAHTVLQCSLCHTGAGRLSGRGEQCGVCHVQDDLHAGSFGNDCGRCHEQLGWLPTTFTHMATGYVLEGIHRMLDCRECHQAGNYFISDRCYGCHLRDYRAAEFHRFEIDSQKITGKVAIGGYQVDGKYQTFDCGECHNQFTFFRSSTIVPQSEAK